MSELKNCPFCGSPAVHIKNNVGVNYITCSNTYEQSKGDCVYDLRVNPKGWSRRPAEAEITALKERESKLIEGLKKAVKSAQFYSRHADCRKDSWACSCEFCKNTSSLKDLREARAVLKELEIEL